MENREKEIRGRMERTVVKRDGRREPVKFDKITARIKKLAYGLDPIVDVTEVAQKVCFTCVLGYVDLDWGRWKV